MNISWKCFLPNLLSFLRRELKKLETGGEATSSVNSPESVKSTCTVLAAQLADKVTTLLYILSQPEKPEVEVVGPILDEIEIFATKLIYAFYSLPKDSGLTLRKQYHQDVLRVIEDLIGVLEALEKLEYVDQSSLRIVDCLTKSCNDIQRSPENNLDAVCRMVEAEESLVLDALEEVTMAFDEATKPCDETEMIWNSEEMEIVPSGIGLIKTARCLLKKIRSSLKSNGKCSSEKEVTQLDNIATNVTKFSLVIDDFVTTLYPPVNESTCIQTSNNVLNLVSSTLELVKDGHFMKEEDSNWHSFLVKALEHNHKKLLESTTAVTGKLTDLQLS